MSDDIPDDVMKAAAAIVHQYENEPDDQIIVALAIMAETERCAKICDDEADRRFANARAVDAGSTNWGIDLRASASAQDNKSITARGLAAAIRSPRP